MKTQAEFSRIFSEEGTDEERRRVLLEEFRKASARDLFETISFIELLVQSGYQSVGMLMVVEAIEIVALERQRGARTLH